MILVKLILMLWCLLNVTGKFTIDLQENESVSVIIRGTDANRIRQLLWLLNLLARWLIVILSVVFVAANLCSLLLVTQSRLGNPRSFAQQLGQNKTEKRLLLK